MHSNFISLILTFSPLVVVVGGAVVVGDGGGVIGCSAAAVAKSIVPTDLTLSPVVE